MKILLFQHATAEHPGSFRQFLKEDAHSLHTVELDKGDKIPPLDNYDALWVMGGPMDVWQQDAHPWLREEKEAIKSAVLEQQMPYLGICLGHQLLADAMGGRVGASQTPEIGVLDVDLTEDGNRSPFFESAPRTIKCLQWHSAEVQSPPQGFSILASSSDCAINAMSFGDTALALQFHVEVESDTVAEWLRIPEYADALIASLGEDGPAKLENDCSHHMADFDQFARLIYRNWCDRSNV